MDSPFLYFNKKIIVLLLVAVVFVQVNKDCYAFFNLGGSQKNTPARRYKDVDAHLKAIQEGESSTSELWVNSSHDDKVEIIRSAIELLKEKESVTIRKSAEFYVGKLEELIKESPDSLDLPLGVLFKTVVILEYDYDEGIDKEETVRKYLGSYYKLFEQVQIDREEAAKEEARDLNEN